MTIKGKSWKERTQTIEQKLRDAECKLRPMSLDDNPVSREMYERGVQTYVQATRPDGKRFWLTWWSKRTGRAGDETRTDFWMCCTDEAPRKTNGPWYTWQHGAPGLPMMATLHKEEPPKGTKNVERYQNPMVTTDEDDVFRWFDTIIAAGLALRGHDIRRPRASSQSQEPAEARAARLTKTRRGKG